MRQRPHRIVVAAEVLRPFASRALNFRNTNRRLQSARDLLGYPILKIEKLVHRAVEARAPNVCSRFSLDQLSNNAQAIADFLNAAFQQVGNA